MKNKIIVTIPGKIHLLGEHSSVHGKPALLTAIDKLCKITLEPQTSSSITLTLREFSETITVKLNDVLSLTEKANKVWKKFSKTNDTKLLKSIIQKSSDYLIIIIGEALRYYKVTKLKFGFKLTIDSDIPVGAGLGSSAACAIGIAAAVTLFLGKTFEKHVINEIAYCAEQKMHGFPSGGDTAAVCFGGLVWYRKESAELKIIQPVAFQISKEITKNFLLIDTGKPDETTGELVSKVKHLFDQKPEKVLTILNDQESLTRQLLTIT